jgi:O-antigen/teichoic acid export membrane protein
VRVPLVPASPREGLALARLGFPVFGLFAASVLLRSVDRLALVRYATPADLGHYSIGLLAAGLVIYLPESAAAVLYPRIAAAAGGSRDRERTRVEGRGRWWAGCCPRSATACPRCACSRWARSCCRSARSRATT